MKITIIDRQKLYKTNRSLLRKICRAVIDCERPDSVSGEFIFYILDDLTMTDINTAAFSKKRPTDVIAYSYIETAVNPPVAAEIFINAEQAHKMHKKYKTSFDYEFILYAVHGILHAFGHDDTAPSKKRKMKKREKYYMTLIFG